MREHEIAPPPGARKEKRRVGRGDGSGMGSYSGRGVKGQKSRTGPGPHRGFEGGQLPLVKRLPHRRGFVNMFKVHYTEVKLERLNAFEDGSEVTPQALFERGIIRELDNPVKVLGNGELSKKLTVVAHKFSQSAKAKVEAAGGSVKEL